MKNFVEKKKIFFLIATIIVLTAIIAYSYFYSPKNGYITEEFNISEITQNNQIIEEEKEKLISIHIAGSVVKEGIIEIEESSRLFDAIEEAGGLTEEADLSNVNLAYTIKDGQKIYIPSTKDEEEKNIITTDMPEYIIPNNNETYESGVLMININSATQTELEELTGIGPSIASNIIRYRKENGRFSSIEEIKNVEGIGEAKYNKIKTNICI